MTASHFFLGAHNPVNNYYPLATRNERTVTRLLALAAVLLLTSAASAQVSFFSPPTYAGSGTPFVADFNGDEKPDILTSDGTMNLGKGDGTFTTGTPVAGGALAVADFNGDGKPDVLQQGTGTLLVLLGNGDGTFQKPITTDTGVPTLSAVTVCDLRGDGKIDVAGIVYNNNSLYLMIFLGNGNGTFATGAPYSLPLSGAFVILGDVNGDGKPDVTVITQGNPGQVIVFLGNGDGTLKSPLYSVGVILPGNSPYPGLAVEGDFNNDGKTDLAISAVSSCVGQCVGAPIVALLLGNGDGTFQAPTTVISENGPLAAADLIGDGNLDLVVETDPTVAEIYLGNGNGTFSNASNYVLSLPVSTGQLGLALADFNLDRKLDVAAGNGILLSNGNGTFQGIPLWVLPATPDAMAIGDFENNGKEDVAAVATDSGEGAQPVNLYILSNNGAGELSLIHTYPLQIGQQYWSMVTADLRGNGDLDLVVFYGPYPNWGYAVLMGNGDGSFQTPIYYTQSGNAPPTSVVVADFNNDHKPDLAVGFGFGGPQPAVLLGNGDGTFAAPVYYYAGGGGVLVAADFNGDGNADLAVGGTGTTGGGTALLIGKRGRHFPAGRFSNQLG